ncbi:MAG: SpoIID/LytB domain-containing protein [Candidatus Rokubacteria bacterium]|nr:SpoIID/LytB domain-containing protein [Candidatus Rokubacteria bacterium]
MRIALAVLVLVAGLPWSAAASGTIRVALVADTPRVELRGTDIEINEIGACERCAGAPWRVDVVRAAAVRDSVEIGGKRATGFRLRSDRAIRLNGREYAGGLELLVNGQGLAVVNELPLEEYVVGVLRAEMGDRWHAEALRAQAIVARTYAAYQRHLNHSKPYHILASTAHQQFWGRVIPASPAWDAVRETSGQVLRWEGELFPAFYHTESGGYTEDPRRVFAARNMPALRPVRCDFSTGSPHYSWNLDVRLTDLAEALRRNGVDVGSVVAIDVTERTPSLRAAAVTVRGSRAAARLRGNDFRRIVGYDTLKSTLFAVAVDGGYARFAGRGYGHGVGLSQWGAKGMAEQGYQARQILEHYYPGATFGWLDER